MITTNSEAKKFSWKVKSNSSEKKRNRNSLFAGAFKSKSPKLHRNGDVKDNACTLSARGKVMQEIYTSEVRYERMLLLIEKVRNCMKMTNNRCITLH